MDNIFNKKISRKYYNYAFAYTLIFPGLIAVIVFVAKPAYDTFVLSFSKFFFGRNLGFIGFKNFETIFSEQLFITVLKNSFIWLFAGSLLSILLGLLIALYIAQENKLSLLTRSIILIPWILPDVLTAITWKWMLNSKFGVINDILLRLSIFENPYTFLGDPETVIYTLVFIVVWRKVPLVALFLCAAIRSVPNEYYEAAKIDGANSFQRFIHITLRHIAFSITAITCIVLIWISSEFGLPWVATKGGPMDSSHIISTYIYQNAFEHLRWGVSSAASVVNIIILCILIISYLLVNKKTLK